MNSRFTDDSLTWRKLCRAAALEQNPDKLVRIVQKIGSALRARQRSLRHVSPARWEKVSHIARTLGRAA